MNFCDIWRGSCVMNRSGVKVFLAVSVQGLTSFRVCRACLRILICESERALGGADRLAHASIQSSPQPNNRPLGWGRGMRNTAGSNGHPDDQGPRDHWPKCCHTRAISALAHSYSVLEGRQLVPSFPCRRHLRGPAQLLPALPSTTAYNHTLPMALTRTRAIHHRSHVTGLE